MGSWRCNPGSSTMEPGFALAGVVGSHRAGFIMAGRRPEISPAVASPLFSLRPADNLGAPVPTAGASIFLTLRPILRFQVGA
jgi:hypothetical protein